MKGFGWAFAAMAMMGRAIELDPSLMAVHDIAITGGGFAPRHRSSGGRAHRQWRKRRSAGRAE